MNYPSQINNGSPEYLATGSAHGGGARVGLRRPVESLAVLGAATWLAACGGTNLQPASTPAGPARTVAVAAPLPVAAARASDETTAVTVEQDRRPVLFVDAAVNDPTNPAELAFTGVLEATAIRDIVASNPPYMTRLQISGVVAGCGVGHFVLEVDGVLASTTATWGVVPGSGTGALASLTGQGTRVPTNDPGISGAYRGSLRCG